jgi:hypothetical protein
MIAPVSGHGRSFPKGPFVLTARLLASVKVPARNHPECEEGVLAGPPFRLTP